MGRHSYAGVYGRACRGLFATCRGFGVRMPGFIAGNLGTIMPGFIIENLGVIVPWFRCHRDKFLKGRMLNAVALPRPPRSQPVRSISPAFSKNRNRRSTERGFFGPTFPALARPRFLRPGCGLVPVLWSAKSASVIRISRSVSIRPG